MSGLLVGVISEYGLGWWVVGVEVGLVREVWVGEWVVLFVSFFDFLVVSGCFFVV